MGPIFDSLCDHGAGGEVLDRLVGRLRGPVVSAAGRAPSCLARGGLDRRSLSSSRIGVRPVGDRCCNPGERQRIVTVRSE